MKEFIEDMKTDFKKYADDGIYESNIFGGRFNDWAEKYNEYSPFSTGVCDPTIKKYFEGLNWALDSAKNDIDKSFTAANDVENAYAKGFEEIAFEMGQYANNITALRSMLLPPQGSEAGEITSSPLNDMDSEDFMAMLNESVMDITEQEAQALIDRYVVDGDWESYVQVLLQKDQQDLTDAECKALKMIYDKLDMENGDKAKFFEMASGSEGFMLLMNDRDIELLADYYTNSGKWEEYVQKQMLIDDPNSISTAEYLVMIAIFEGLDLDGKAKFIELAYSLEEKPVDPNGSGMFRDPYCAYILSPVFDKMSSIYAQMINQMINNLGDFAYDTLKEANDANNIIHEKIFWSQLLLGISVLGQEVLYYTPDYNSDSTTYDGTHGIKVEIKSLKDIYGECLDEIELSPWDYAVTINGYTSVEGVLVEEDAELLSLNLFQFSVNLTSILHYKEKLVLESMIPDANQEIGKIIFESALGEVPGLSAFIAVFDIMTAINDEEEGRKKGDAIKEDMKFEEISKALQLGATAIIRSDGQGIFGTANINEVILREKIGEYNDYNKRQAKNFDVLDAEVVINMIKSGDVMSKDFDFTVLEGYIRWYNRFC